MDEADEIEEADEEMELHEDVSLRAFLMERVSSPSPLPAFLLEGVSEDVL